MKTILQRLIHPRWLRHVGAAAAQEERNRLARDLHDSIKQQLFSIKVSSAAVQERWERDPEGARKSLADVQQSAQEAMVEMQALLHQLRPEAVAAIGLVEALREQCEALGYRTGAEVALELGEQAPDGRLIPGTQEAVFRIAQEALANVARHARARHVRAELGCHGDEVVLRVQDDGQGFDPAAAPRGMGLHNLEERARALGGRCTVESAPGAGTTVAVSIPLATPPPAVTKTARLFNILLEIVIHPLLFSLLYSQFFDERRALLSDPFTRFLLLYMALNPGLLSWWQTRRASRGAPARPVLERISGYRVVALYDMVCFFGLFPWNGLPVEEGTAARIAWLAASLLCLGLAVFNLIRYHRLTGELRRRRSSRWIGGLLAFLLAALLAALAPRMGLRTFNPFQLTVALTYASIYIYALWREVPCYLRPQEAAS